MKANYNWVEMKMMLLKVIRLLERILSSLSDVAKMIRVYTIKYDEAYRECMKVLAEVYANVDDMNKILKKCKRKEIYDEVRDVQIRLNDMKILIEQLYTQSLKIKMNVSRKQVLQRIVVEVDKNIDLLHKHFVLYNTVSQIA